MPFRNILDNRARNGHETPMANSAPLPSWRAPLGDLVDCLRFYTRLPLPVLAFETAPYAMPDFSRMVRVLPLAGALIGVAGALVLGIARALGLPAMIAATLAVAALVTVTGAMHEDGLADCADGFGGGATRERKLEIMKDSRIGTFGGAALVLSLLLRVLALGTLAGHGFWVGALGLIAASGFSRACGLLPLALLPAARSDGAGRAAGKPDPQALQVTAGLAVAVGLAPLLAGMPLRAVIAGGLCAAATGWGVAQIARVQISGQTGDVAGAAQQAAEIAFLLALVAGSGAL